MIAFKSDTERYDLSVYLYFLQAPYVFKNMSIIAYNNSLHYKGAMLSEDRLITTMREQ